ncbi:MAG: hypothetical protein ABSC94_01845 [Polyangiaceae bacterium]|jgi:hypothetical protein
MRLEATLGKEDLLDVFGQLAPLEIRVGEGGTLLLACPTEVMMIPGDGVKVVCDATFHWPVLGVGVPVHMRGLRATIRPAIRDGSNEASDVLAFTLKVDHAGVSLLPASFDERVTSHLNKELVSRHIELAWNYGQTLSHVFSLPATLVSAAALALKVIAGTVEVTEGAVVFAVDFGAAVERRKGTIDRRSA